MKTIFAIVASLTLAVTAHAEELRISQQFGL
jgi:hypothetical protein